MDGGIRMRNIYISGYMNKEGDDYPGTLTTILDNLNPKNIPRHVLAIWTQGEAPGVSTGVRGVGPQVGGSMGHKPDEPVKGRMSTRWLAAGDHDHNKAFAHGQLYPYLDPNRYHLRVGGHGAGSPGKFRLKGNPFPDVGELLKHSVGGTSFEGPWDFHLNACNRGGGAACSIRDMVKQLPRGKRPTKVSVAPAGLQGFAPFPNPLHVLDDSGDLVPDATSDNPMNASNLLRQTHRTLVRELQEELKKGKRLPYSIRLDPSMASFAAAGGMAGLSAPDAPGETSASRVRKELGAWSKAVSDAGQGVYDNARPHPFGPTRDKQEFETPHPDTGGTGQAAYVGDWVDKFTKGTKEDNRPGAVLLAPSLSNQPRGDQFLAMSTAASTGHPYVIPNLPENRSLFEKLWGEGRRPESFEADMMGMVEQYDKLRRGGASPAEADARMEGSHDPRMMEAFRRARGMGLFLTGHGRFNKDNQV